MYTRRHLLVAATAAAATGGCTEALGDSGGSDPGDADGVRLDELSVLNNHHRDHRLQLAVEADGEMLHLGTYELDGDGGSQTIEGEWNDTAGSYRVNAKLDDGEIRTADVTEGVGTETTCVRVLVRVDSAGELAVWNGSDCGSNGEDPDLEDV